MLDHLAFDDGRAPHFAAAFSAALAGAYADAMARMTEALTGRSEVGVLTIEEARHRLSGTDAKPAVAGLLSETPAGRYRGIGWCDGA